MIPRVYLFNSPHFVARGEVRKVSGYCGLTHPLLEGMHDLGVRTVCAHQGLHVRDIGPFEPDYDLYIVQRAPHVDGAEILGRLQDHGCLSRTVLIDSLDHRFGFDPFW